MEYFPTNSSLRFWELQFSKSHMTSDVVYVPINSSLQFWELQFSKSHTTSDVVYVPISAHSKLWGIVRVGGQGWG